MTDQQQLWFQWSTEGRRRYYLLKFGDDWEDYFNEGFLAVLRTNSCGQIERFDAYCRGITRHQFVRFCEQKTEQRLLVVDGDRQIRSIDSADDRISLLETIAGSESTEELAVKSEQRSISEQALRSLKASEQEILTRYYLQEQEPARIMREMEMTYTQFRLLKSRAKIKYGNAGRAICRQRTTPDERTED